MRILEGYVATGRQLTGAMFGHPCPLRIEDIERDFDVKPLDGVARDLNYFTPMAIMSPPDNLAVPTEPKNAFEARGLAQYLADPKAFMAKAMEEWKKLVALYQSLGINVFIIPPEPDLSDQSYTADPAVMLQRPDGSLVAVVGKFFARGRAGENAAMKRQLELMGFDEIHTISKGHFESAGDIREDFRRKALWVGYGPRSSREGAEEFATIANSCDMNVWLLELVKQPSEADQKFFHLDTCFFPLPNGKILWVPEAFTKESQDAIKKVGARNLIEVSVEEAEGFCTNVKAVRYDTLVIPSTTSQRLKELLGKDFKLFEADVSTFMLVGGGVSCLSNTLYRSPRLSLEDALVQSLLNVRWIEKTKDFFRKAHPERLVAGNPDLLKGLHFLLSDSARQIANTGLFM